MDFIRLRDIIAKRAIDADTSDLLSVPIGHGAVLPLTEYANRVEFDPNAGILGSLRRALTAPGVAG